MQVLHYAIQPQEQIWSIVWGGYCPIEGKPNYSGEVEVVPYKPGESQENEKDCEKLK